MSEPHSDAENPAEDSSNGKLGRVFAAATRVPSAAPATLASWAGTATDVMNAARTNKGMVADLVRLEVERVVGALGLVTPTELMALRKRVSELERQVAKLEKAAAEASTVPPPRATAGKTTGSKKSDGSSAKASKTTAAKKAAKKTTAAKSGSTKSGASRAAKKTASAR